MCVTQSAKEVLLSWGNRLGLLPTVCRSKAVLLCICHVGELHSCVHLLFYLVLRAARQLHKHRFPCARSEAGKSGTRCTCADLVLHCLTHPRGHQSSCLAAQGSAQRTNAAESPLAVGRFQSCHAKTALVTPVKLMS